MRLAYCLQFEPEPARPGTTVQLIAWPTPSAGPPTAGPPTGRSGSSILGRAIISAIAGTFTASGQSSRTAAAGLGWRIPLEVLLAFDEVLQKLWLFPVAGDQQRLELDEFPCGI